MAIFVIVAGLADCCGQTCSAVVQRADGRAMLQRRQKEHSLSSESRRVGCQQCKHRLKEPLWTVDVMSRGDGSKAGRRGRDGCWVSVLLLAVGRMPRSGPGKARCREKVVGANRCPRAGICSSCLNFSDVKS